MNCREFRRQHDGYVDDTLSGVELDAMGRHLRFCERCAQLDTRIRRSLLLARNLPTIHPSDAFSQRLQARLAVERSRPAGERATAIDSYLLPHQRGRSTSTYMGLAAGILMAAGIVGSVSYAGGVTEPIRIAPVIASTPEPEPSPLASSAMVASMPAGMPIWPAVFVAQQAPWHFASDVTRR